MNIQIEFCNNFSGSAVLCIDDLDILTGRSTECTHYSSSVCGNTGFKIRNEIQFGIWFVSGYRFKQCILTLLVVCNAAKAHYEDIYVSCFEWIYSSAASDNTAFSDFFWKFCKRRNTE